MNKAYYRQKKTMERWQDGYIIGYLNEEVVENYLPAEAEGDGEAKPYTAYAYTGVLPDGGTVMPCGDMTDYHQVANAIIRSKYSSSDELAIQRHAINGDYDDDSTEYQEYDGFCKNAVAMAKEWVKNI